MQADQARAAARTIPEWVSQAIFLLVAFGLVACVGALWREHDAVLPRLALGSMLVLAASGFVTVLASHRRGAADRNAPHGQTSSRFFETSLDLLLVTDRAGLFIRVSPCCEAILGYRPEEMIGQPGIRFVHPDDLDPTRTEMRLARRGREIRHFESRYVHKDGHPVTLSWTGVWSEPEQRHYFIGRDMTVQKQLESAERDAKDMLKAVFDASPVAIVCLRPNGTVLMWSRAAEEIFGYSAEETVGRHYNLVPQGGEAEFHALFERARRGEVLRDIRVKRARKDGKPVDISFDAAAIWEDGDVRAVAYALTDITERNRMEQQLRQAQKLDAIGQLTGGVAHDFNNVLSAITGTIDILAAGVADRPDLAEIAKLISEAADHGAQLTGRLLAFARKQPLQPRKIDVRRAAEEAAMLLKPTLGEQIEFEWRFDSATAPAMADEAQLATALLNLAVNARDAMPDGGKLTFESGNAILDEAYASAHSEVRPGAYVVIAVSDTGPGIPAHLQEKIFEPFFTTKEVGKGTGLGLSMVYGFVKQSNGHIKVYSEEGHGTTFKIYLPPADGTGEIEARAAADLRGGHETILVVEDDAAVRRSVTVQLQSLGYTPIIAANAQEALAIIDAGTAFDLLFTDVVMPGPLNGPRLAAEAAKRRTGLKVLFTSGYTERAMVHHGRLDPDMLLLPKPYRTLDLARMIRVALETPGNRTSASKH